MTIEIIKLLYVSEGFSAREIGEKLNLTTWQVIALLKKNNISRRSSAETQRLQFHKTPLSYNKKKKLSIKDEQLFDAGLMLYWGEGGKYHNGVVDFANCDEKMILIFLKLLRNIYQVDEKKLRILLYCYSNQNHTNLVNYWSKKLNIRHSQFIKPYIRKDFDEKKINKMPKGLIHVRYNDKRLLMQIISDIDIIATDLLNC